MNNTERYVRATNIKKMYDVSYTTLRRWAEDGKIRCTDGAKRLYHLGDVQFQFNGRGTSIEPRRKICYARVSSSHQKEDLERQIELLKSEFPNNEFITDIGSGLNWKRKGFKTLLDGIIGGMVEEVAISYKDRLCRFGYELIEYLCEKFNTKLVVLHKTIEPTPETELSEDLLSIITIFVARNNGLRSGKNKKSREEGKEGKKKNLEKEANSTRDELKNQENKNVSNQE